MVKVCVADDEQYIRISLERRLALSPVATVFAGSAENGDEAVRLYRRVRPDIFFVDIKMPGLGGLEVIRAVRAEFPDAATLFVVISGYDDFVYLQQSIRLGVLNYIKKPIVQEELDDTLQAAVDALNRRALHPWADSQASVPLEEFVQRHPLDEKPREPSLLVAVHARGGLDDRALRDMLPVVEGEKICRKAYWVTFRGIPQVALLYLEGFCPDRQDARALAARVCRGCGERAVYHMARDEPLQQAMELLENRLNARFCSGGLVLEACRGGGKGEPDLSLLKVALERGHEQSSRSQLRKLLSDCMADGDGGTLGRVYRDVILLLIHIFGAQAPRTLEMELLWFALARFPTWEDMLENLNGYAESWLRTLREANIDQDLIQQVCAFLDAHYAEEVSLQGLADSFFVSPTYLSKRFKEKKQITITGYLEELRLRKARDLLEGSALSISQVCAAVGYNDANYFSRLFRKRYRITPSRFRQEMGE